MRKYIFIISVAVLSIYFLGCGKKQQSLEEMQVPMSIETLATRETKTTPEATTAQPVQLSQAEIKQAAAKLGQLPPSGPYKPATTEIQAALKNAGFYTGVIDGKKGPLTKRAIEEFQKANNLGVDGKVGPKTWVVLSRYLNTVPVEPAAQVKKR